MYTSFLKSKVTIDIPIRRFLSFSFNNSDTLDTDQFEKKYWAQSLHSVESQLADSVTQRSS